MFIVVIVVRCEERGYWGSFLYKKREFSIQEFMIYHHISCISHDISLYIIYEIMIYHVPRRHT